MCEMLNSLEAPVFIERVALGDNKQIMQAATRACAAPWRTRSKGLGFSFVEVLSPCPTIWKLDPVEAQTFVREEMAATFPVGNLRDRTERCAPRVPRPRPLRLLRICRASSAWGMAMARRWRRSKPSKPLDLRIKVAGFGGQGVLMLGEVLAEAGLDAGYEVSWLPSYGPEMRSGTSNCHVRIGSRPVDSPLVSRPNVLLAMNEPSLRKFLPDVEPGGIVLYNTEEPFPDGVRADVRMVARHFTGMADQIGSSKAANIVMLGALLEATGILEEKFVLGALKKKVKSQRWFDIDTAAMEAGRREIRQGGGA